MVFYFLFKNSLSPNYIWFINLYNNRLNTVVTCGWSFEPICLDGEAETLTITLTVPCGGTLSLTVITLGTNPVPIPQVFNNWGALPMKIHWYMYVTWQGQNIIWLYQRQINSNLLSLGNSRFFFSWKNGILINLQPTMRSWKRFRSFRSLLFFFFTVILSVNQLNN